MPDLVYTAILLLRQSEGSLDQLYQSRDRQPEHRLMSVQHPAGCPYRRLPSPTLGSQAYNKHPAAPHRLAAFPCSRLLPSGLCTRQVTLPLSCCILLHTLLGLTMRLDIPSMVTGAGEEQPESRSSPPHSQSLSDGRLNVGTHLPLMAKRYAYLSLIGEGTSAQVCLPSNWQFQKPLCWHAHCLRCLRHTVY